MMAPPKTLAAAAVRPSRTLRRMGCMYAGDDTSSRSGGWPNGADQAIQYLPQFGRFVHEMLSMLRRKILQILGDHQLGFHFDQRGSRPCQKVVEFISGETCLPLCNIGGNAHRRSTQLAGKPV